MQSYKFEPMPAAYRDLNVSPIQMLSASIISQHREVFGNIGFVSSDKSFLVDQVKRMQRWIIDVWLKKFPGLQQRDEIVHLFSLQKLSATFSSSIKVLSPSNFSGRSLKFNLGLCQQKCNCYKNSETHFSFLFKNLGCCGTEIAEDILMNCMRLRRQN